MSCNDKQPAYGDYDCLMPADYEKVASDNNNKTRYQHKHWRKAVSLADIRDANSGNPDN